MKIKAKIDQSVVGFESGVFLRLSKAVENSPSFSP